MSRRLTVLFTLAAALVLRADLAAAQTCFGDCNGDGSLTASDISAINTALLHCGPCEGGVPGAVATGCEALPAGCVAADLDKDGCVRASDLALANKNALTLPNGCAAQATPTEGAAATSTPTEALPTATSTPQPTNTPPPTNTAAATATRTQTVTPTLNPAVCPNGLLEAGETCASCASDCNVSACTAVATPPRTFRVDWSAPTGQPVSALKVRLAYRSNLMSLPGTGSAPAARIKNRPSNTTTIVNDLNYATEVTMTRNGTLPVGRLFTIDFDGCQGAAVPALSDLFCTVLDCGSAFGSVDGCSCVVVTP